MARLSTPRLSPLPTPSLSPAPLSMLSPALSSMLPLWSTLLMPLPLPWSTLVSTPLQGEHRATTQSKAFGANVAAVHDSPSPLNGAHSRNGLAVVGHRAVIG